MKINAVIYECGHLVVIENVAAGEDVFVDLLHIQPGKCPDCAKGRDFSKSKSRPITEQDFCGVILQHQKKIGFR